MASLSVTQRAEAVSAFNSRYGEMERALWCLSLHCRPVLLEGTSDAVVEALVWTLESWRGVQGVRTETKALTAEALVLAVAWTPDMFEATTVVGSGAEEFAFDCVSALVSRSVSLGVPRREFSLASMVLPWRVPIYDGLVRKYLGVPGTWDHPQAYRRVVRDVFTIARDTGQDLSWAGSLEPLSPMHALDKSLWWLAGGDSETAALVKDPWRVVDRLGLERC